MCFATKQALSYIISRTIIESDSLTSDASCKSENWLTKKQMAKKPNKKTAPASSKYPDMPTEEQNLRAEIDQYLDRHPGKDGNNYEYPQMTKKEKKRRDILYTVRMFLPVAILAVLIYVIFKIGTVPSTSMEPALNKGDFILANRLAYTLCSPQRGDIVIFRKNGTYLVKRIIGLPGETIELKGGNVYINDVLLNEPYLLEETFTLPFSDGNGQYIFEVPGSAYLMLGDNRSFSADARVWTDKNGSPSPYVSEKYIVGKVILSVGKNGVTSHNGYSLVSGEIYSYEITTSDQISATTDPNSVPTDPQLIIVETLPIDHNTEAEGVSSEQTENTETLPIEEFSVPEKEVLSGGEEYQEELSE